MTKLLRFSVLLISVATLVYLGNLTSLIGEHKLCEDMTLKENQEKKFSFDIKKDERFIRLNGPLEIGVLTEFEKVLSEHPRLLSVILNSEGGNIYQARGVANLILSHSLDTYVFDECYSACMIIYLAGTKRFIGPNGKLGFHQYNADLNFMNPAINIEKEQNKDIVFFTTRIPDPDFIEKIFDSPCTDIWIPDKKMLINAGVVHELIPENKH